jgi:hypothetical protein
MARSSPGPVADDADRGFRVFLRGRVGQGGIVTGRIEGKASLDVRLDFTGVSHRTSIDGE